MRIFCISKKSRTILENKAMATTPITKISFAEYLNYDDGTNNRYELVEGKISFNATS